MKVTKRASSYIILVINALLWSVPIALNSVLIAYQYSQGTGSLFLIEIGILPYVIGLVVAVLIPLFLLYLHRDRAALILTIVMFGFGILAGLFFVVGMGST